MKKAAILFTSQILIITQEGCGKVAIEPVTDDDTDTGSGGDIDSHSTAGNESDTNSDANSESDTDPDLETSTATQNESMTEESGTATDSTTMTDSTSTTTDSTSTESYPDITGNPEGEIATPAIYWSSPSVASFVSFSIDFRVDRLASDPTPWYWATQMGFVDGSAFYYGVQPNGNGHAALFSVFGAGPTVVNSTSCHSGADGGDGVSCYINYNWEPKKLYRLTVSLGATDANNNTWKGTIADISTGVSTDIGAWTTPLTWGHISPGNMSWLEWYGGSAPCAERTDCQVFFGNPVGTDADGMTYTESASGTKPGTCANFVTLNEGVVAAAGNKM